VTTTPGATVIAVPTFSSPALVGASTRNTVTASGRNREGSKSCAGAWVDQQAAASAEDSASRKQ
jgi:hypothetical protein